MSHGGARDDLRADTREIAILRGDAVRGALPPAGGGIPGGAHAPDEPDLLREQFRQLLRYRLLITLGVLLGLAGGLYLGMTAQDTYIATGEVVVRAPARDPFEGTTLDRVAMGSERRTAVSDTVAARAASVLGLPEDAADGLKADLQVTNPPNTEVLRFAYTATDPRAAAERANAFIAAYLGNRQEYADGQVETMVARYTEQREPLLAQLETLDLDINEAPDGSRAYDEAVATRAAVTAQIGDINNQISVLRSLDTSGGRVITRATEPGSPSGPGLVMMLGLGGTVGIGAGLLAAWIRLVFDPRVRSAGDVTRALRAPVLGVLPRGARPAPGQLLAEGRLAEEIRSVAFRLAYDETFAARRRLLVVAPRGSIGTPLVTSVNLSAAFAEMGKDALLIEADLRTPSLTEQLRHADGVRPGWASAPGRGDGVWPTGLRVPIDAGESGVFDLVPGLRVRNVPRALTSPAASRLIEHADAKGSVVVVLAPAVLSYADAIALVDRVDGVLVVCDPREVRRDDLTRVRELVVGAGGLLLGAVLHSWGTGSDQDSGRGAGTPRAKAPGGQRPAAGEQRKPAPRAPAAEDGGALTATVPSARTETGAGRDPAGYRDVGSETLGLRIVDPDELEERANRQ
ncbi:lipopolysaccharide biosynthesis protein [Streptomyces aidingensis]|uniref:Chromosome partitioning ATPase, Mrp family, contains Fe-S cluster n=1 Tax=Streptomyces aidingensis TaxID=910347 RepID=A0A1I1L657_9ACTN|nr:lipopolysaccharide biosynthesis protein [Streptomyces aidingensis]SFC68519.1 Chromosome partitioning ATPase, Mrp family, contains Fe-S cluster [Streptomyces aidingensis]